MNIFQLSLDPVVAATMAVDKHVVKMPTETVQMLSTNLHLKDIDEDWMYKSFNPNHPSTAWARQSKENYTWLVEHGIALCAEYTKRYGKVHKCEAKIKKALPFADLMPNKPYSRITLVMPAQFHTIDPVHSYRMFYAASKFKFATWKTEEPMWWKEYRQLVQTYNMECVNEKDDGLRSLKQRHG